MLQIVKVQESDGWRWRVTTDEGRLFLESGRSYENEQSCDDAIAWLLAFGAAIAQAEGPHRISLDDINSLIKSLEDS